MKTTDYLKSFNVIGIVLWLLFAVGVFFLIKHLWRSILKFLGIKPTLPSLSDSDRDSLLNEANSHMSNGYTYGSAAAYLFEKMYTKTGTGWYTTTDHEAVGNFMRSVNPSEYTLLKRMYTLYKKDNTPIFAVVGLGDDLTDDLKDLFDSSEETKYISHLKNVY